MKDQQLFKGSLSTIVLKLLRDNGRMYGYQLAQKITEITGGEWDVTEGSLYPGLYKLEEAGFITPEFEVVNSRIRKYYSLTEKGRRELEPMLARMKRFMQHLDNIFRSKSDPLWAREEP